MTMHGMTYETALAKSILIISLLENFVSSTGEPNHDTDSHAYLSSLQVTVML